MAKKRDEKFFDRLGDAVAATNVCLDGDIRKRRKETIREFTGSDYSNDGAEKEVMLNLVENVVMANAQHLAASVPSVTVMTPFPELRPSAAKLQMGMRHLFEEIGLQAALHDLSIHALIGMGVAKVALDSRVKMIDGFPKDVGQPYVESLSMNNFVFDMAASALERMSFAGDSRFEPLDAMEASGLYTKKIVDKLHDVSQANILGLSGSRKKQTLFEPLYKQVLLWDIYLPREQVIITMADPRIGKGKDYILREEEWSGPEVGPYHYLRLETVPDAIYPLPVTSIALRLHALINSTLRKVARQIDREKALYVVPIAGEKDAKAINDASDGDTVAVGNPNIGEMVNFGGANVNSIAAILQMKQMHSDVSGNLDALFGTGPQAPTLGQERLINATVSKRMERMANAMMKTVHSVVTALAQYLWEEPNIDLPFTMPVRGTNISLPVRWTPEMREGDFLQYNFVIHEHSMEHISSQRKADELKMTLSDTIMPMYQMMAQQGMQVDFAKLFELYAQFRGMPEWAEVLKFATPSLEVASGPIGGDHPKATQTTRNVIRHDNPALARGQNPQANIQEMLALGSGSQGQQGGSVRRGGA